MSETSDWDWGRYHKVLHLVLRVTQLHPLLTNDKSELVQEALVKAIQAKHQCRATCDGGRIAWLKTILKNVAHDWLEKKLAEKNGGGHVQSIHDLVVGSSKVIDAMLPDDAQPTPSERLMREEELLRIAEAVADLRELQRDVLILRHFHKASVAEITAQLKPIHPTLTKRAVAGL
jgi:RNA polymerase sigma factor (sigma-70 family)